MIPEEARSQQQDKLSGTVCVLHILSSQGIELRSPHSQRAGYGWLGVARQGLDVPHRIL